MPASGHDQSGGTQCRVLGKSDRLNSGIWNAIAELGSAIGSKRALIGNTNARDRWIRIVRAWTWQRSNTGRLRFRSVGKRTNRLMVRGGPRFQESRRGKSSASSQWESKASYLSYGSATLMRGKSPTCR